MFDFGFCKNIPLATIADFNARKLAGKRGVDCCCWLRQRDNVVAQLGECVAIVGKRLLNAAKSGAEHRIEDAHDWCPIVDVGWRCQRHWLLAAKTNVIDAWSPESL